jgi:hypothetical protein
MINSSQRANIKKRLKRVQKELSRQDSLADSKTIPPSLQIIMDRITALVKPDRTESEK